MTRRVGIVGVWHETNTYSSRPTTLADFEAFELLSGESVAEQNRGLGTVIGGFCDHAEVELVPIFSAGAWPSGPVDAAAFARILDGVTDGVRRAGRLDGILLNLHGAMVAEGVPDVEAAVVGAIRDAAGELPLGGVLDLHANPSPELVRECDVLVSYDTFPHVDMRERGSEVAAILSRSLRGPRLRTKVRKLPLLVCPLAQATAANPMRDLQRAAAERARAAGLARISIVGGFAYSDVERAGMSVLVVHEEGQEAAAASAMEATVADIAARADEFAVARDDPATAVAKAIRSTRRPVFLVDVADNIGGGSPGDGTALLRELLAAGATNAVVTIADREVAREAARLGPGAAIDTLLGGKTDRMHGDPVRVRGRVERVTDGRYRSGGYYMTGREFSMGTTAVLSVAGNTVVVTELAVPPFHSEQLTSVGVDPRRAAIVTVKGAIAWRGAYQAIAGEIIEVATPGICPVDVSALPRRTVPIAF
ncbi:MAG TPA: M81 family metallopeptidase [Natronosporangium sp.]